MGFARIFQKTKTPRLIWRRPNLMFQAQDFQSYKWKKKNQSARCIKPDGFPPPKKCHFAPSFIFFKNYFYKEFKKNALDLNRVLFKDESRLKLMSFLS